MSDSTAALPANKFKEALAKTEKAVQSVKAPK